MARNIKELTEAYQKKRDSIKTRLDEFSNATEWSEERIFAELSFCICTPQSKAIACWNAISSLDKNGLLYDGTEEQVRPYLKDVRFANKKTKYIKRNKNTKPSKKICQKYITLYTNKD